MLVYFVNHSTAPVSLGGAERSMIRLVEDWYGTDPNFEAFFITKHPRGQFVDAIEKRGWAYQTFRYRGWATAHPARSVDERRFLARDDYRSVLEIVDLMESRRPDLVVTNTLVAPWGAFAAAILGIPHAWFVREYGDLDHGLQFEIGRRQTFEDIALLSQAVFTNSFALRRHLAGYVDDSNITVVYPEVDVAGVEAAAADTTPATPFRGDDGLKITMVGRLAESKGQWRVIDALAELSERGVRAQLCLVGSREESDYDRKLVERARALGVADRLTIVGGQANPFPFVAAADVCVTASGIEAFGRSTLEYMVLGKPVIASAGGGSSELVVSGTTGFLFELDEAGTLADHLAHYAANPADASLHGAAGARRARELIAGEHGNASAIERLRETAGITGYRLPNVARSWFGLPALYSGAGGQSPRLTVGFLRSRLPGRIRRELGNLGRRLRRDRRD
jgi:glycosyltransferase involved in cell wall biosynthesis